MLNPNTPVTGRMHSLNAAWRWLFLLAYVIIVLGPLVFLGGQAIWELWGQDNRLAIILPGARRLTLLANSIGLAATVAVIGLGIGCLVASLLWRWGTGPLSYLRWLPLILACLPPYIHALVWSKVFENLAGATGTALFQGWPASAWVQIIALVPLATGLALLGLETIDTRLIEAARMLRPDLANLWKIAFPLAAPLILAGGGFLFLFSLVDYSVPALFQRSVYALEIFADYSASYRAGQTFWVALPLLLVASLVSLASQGGLASLAQSPRRSEHPWKTHPNWPPTFALLQWAALLVLGLQVFLPLFVLIGSSGTWADLVTTIRMAHNEITYTFWIAAMTACICLPLAVAVVFELKRSRARSWHWWLLVVLPLAVPAPLVGIGLVAVWNHSLLSGVYGGLGMPVLAGLARFTPLAVILIYAQWRRVDPLLIDAARILRADGFRTWFQVRLPALAPGLLAAACLVFALTVGELGATLIVAPPGQATLTMRIYNYLHYGASNVVAGLCLIMVAASLVAGLLAALALLGWSYLLPKTGGQA